MQAYLDDNNLVDLISDKHAKLRKKVIDTWEQNSKEKITDTESYMIAIIYKENTTVAQIAKKIGISRQGAHKCAKVLIERGYIEIEEHQDNSRDKFLCLTDKGRYFMEETLHIKRDLENQIIKSIGKEKFDMMKEIFSSSWFE
ncbi:MarR family winged helix-turn-helix transcriptional regulator [Intestinibacter bartlettii]|uniref:MarR family transcriptional regulator n=1 Tax=Intestinibacter bartlettii TaxID=261299 RepID=A0ABS6DUK5_9FIRM|nr:MarR family transcriptional regulator [Intestinibacter bartlettii]MBU5335511.1 MarR family transcriptional regulator [Intestinibacter bartlettii]MDO5010464.1 MarR family transcriptional regulator [Intestinibacter bartlettii]